MNINRAKEILEATENLEVLYHGSPVWLENVNSDNQMAYVRVLENDENIVVPVIDLNETGRELK